MAYAGEKLVAVVELFDLAMQDYVRIDAEQAAVAAGQIQNIAPRGAVAIF